MNTLSWLVDDALQARLTLSLLHFLWQGCCIGLLVWIYGAMFSAVSARLRYSLNVMCLLAMAGCLPVTFMLVNGPVVANRASPSQSAIAAVSPPSTSIDNSVQPAEPRLPAAAADVTRATKPGVARNRVITSAGPLESTSSRTNPTDWVHSFSSMSTAGVVSALSRWIVPLYLIGVACILGRLVLGVWGGHRLRRLAIPIEDETLLTSFRKLAKRVGLRAAPAVAWCEQISVPVVVGIVRPMVLLPLAVVSNLTPDQLQALMLHELSHIRRYDPIINLLQRIVEAILFFHPVVWFVSRRISIEREHAADDMVLAAGWDRPLYADALVRMAELAAAVSGRSTANQAAVLAAAGTSPSEFKVRILRLLGESRPSEFALSRSSILLALALVLVGSVLAWSQVQSPEAKKDPVPGAAKEPGKEPTMPPLGLEFLKAYPALHGLSLEMTEVQFLEFIKQQKMTTTKSGRRDKTYYLPLGDGHTLIVMFDKAGGCRGIQRLRGEDEDPGRLLAGVANKLDPNNSVLTTIDNGSAIQSRAVIKQLDDAGERKLASIARERLAARWKRISEQPVLSFVRPGPPRDPRGVEDRGELVGVQTDLDGVWSNAKGTADNWKDWIVRKQNDYRVERLRLLFEAAAGFRKVDDPASAERVLTVGLTGYEIYDAELETLLGKYWPVTNDKPEKSLGSGPHAWTLVNFLTEFSSAQQELGETEEAIDTHSRLTLAHFMLSWNHPSAGPTQHARELWSLIREQPESLPPLFWFNLSDEKKPQRKFDLSKAGQKGEPLTYHHQNLAAAPPLEFKELSITAKTQGRAGFLDCYRINAAGKHETIGLLQASASGEAKQTLTKKLSVPPGTSLVQFMVAGDGFQVGEVTVEATFVAPATMGAAPEFGLGQRQDLVQWSHDSQQLYATGDFSKLTIWEHSETGWKPQSLKAEHHANSLAASRKSPLLLAGTNVGTAEVWDATTQKRRNELRSSPNYSVYAVAISADDKLVAVCGTNGTVHVFDRELSKSIVVLGEKADTRMASLAFAPDGKTLAALDRYGHLVLWKLSDQTQIADWKNIAGEDCSVHWSPDGKQLAVSGWGRVTLIAAEKGGQPRVIEAPEAVLSRHPKSDDGSVRSGPEPGGIKFASVTAIAPDLRTVASVAPDASIGIWDLATRKIVLTLPAPKSVAIMDSQSAGLRNLTFSPNGLRLACTTQRGDVVFWQLGKEAAAAAPPNEKPGGKTAQDIENLRDEDVEAFALATVRTPYEPDGSKGSWQGGAHDAQVLLRLGLVRQQDRVVKALLKIVDRTERSEMDQRRLAMMYLGGHAPQAVVPLLIKELEAAVRIPQEKFAPNHEIAVLGQIGVEARDAIPVLVKLLDNRDRLAAEASLLALVKIGPSSTAVMNEIVTRFGEPDKEAWSRAVYEVGRYGELAKPLGPTFVKLLKSKSMPARTWAAQALVKSKFDEQRGFDELMADVAAGKPEDRGLAATALAALGNQAQPVLSKLKAFENDPNPEVAKEVRDAIRRIEKDDRIFTHAEEAAKKVADRQAAEAAIRQINAAPLPDLRLTGDEVTPEAIAKLASKDWGTVTLAEARFTGEIVERLRHASSIRELRLFGIGLSGQIPRLDHVSGLIGLEIGAPLTGHDLEAIGELTQLEALSLPLELTLNVTGAQEIARLVRLKALRLYNVNIDDAAFVELRTLIGLEELDLTHTRVTDEGLKIIEKMPGLRVLELHRHPDWYLKQQLTDACLASISRLPKLERLSLSGKITNDGLKQVGRWPKLKTLSILNTEITSAGLAALEESNIEQLTVGTHQLSDEPVAAQHLKKCRQLKSIHVIGKQSTIDSQWQERLPNLSWSFTS